MPAAGAALEVVLSASRHMWLAAGMPMQGETPARRLAGWLEGDNRSPEACPWSRSEHRHELGLDTPQQRRANPCHGQGIEICRGLAVSMGAGLSQPRMVAWGFCLQSSAYE